MNQQLDPALIQQLMSMEDPENDPELQQITRQRRLLEKMRGDTTNNMQGQMVSGHFVAPSALAQAANMASGAMGVMQDRRLDGQVKANSDRRGQGREAYFNAMLQRMRGGMGMPQAPAIDLDYGDQ